MNEISQPDEKPINIGIIISRGVTVRIPAGGLVIHENSSHPRLEVRAIELQLDTCIHWLEIALDHLANAKTHSENLKETQENGAGSINHLDCEFKSGVQAAVAAATFFEALFAAVQERSPVKPSRRSPNARSKSSRARQVTEQLRQGFGLKTKGTSNLYSVLSEIYKFRDQAVHPSARFEAPALHPVLRTGVERKFVMFCYESAYTLVRGSLAFAKILPSRDLSKRPKEIQELAANLLTMVEPLIQNWENTYGFLLDQPSETQDLQ